MRIYCRRILKPHTTETMEDNISMCEQKPIWVYTDSKGLCWSIGTNENEKLMIKFRYTKNKKTNTDTQTRNSMSWWLRESLINFSVLSVWDFSPQSIVWKENRRQADRQTDILPCELIRTLDHCTVKKILNHQFSQIWFSDYFIITVPTYLYM